MSLGPTSAISPDARLRPARNVSLRLTVRGLPHVVFALLSTNGKPVAIPSSIKPQAGKCIAGTLLVCDENGSLVLAKIRAVATTLHLLPVAGTENAKSCEHAKARAGDTLVLTMKEVCAGVKIPIDLASAKASGEFVLTIDINVAHVLRCC